MGGLMTHLAQDIAPQHGGLQDAHLREAEPELMLHKENGIRTQRSVYCCYELLSNFVMQAGRKYLEGHCKNCQRHAVD